MKILSKILIVLIFLTACDSENPAKNLLIQHKLSNECLLELVDGDYTDGKVLDVVSFMRRPPFEKKDYPSGSEEDLEQWYRERYIGSFDGWEYIGSTGPYHVILTHMTGDTWRRHTILVLKFVEKGITVISTIMGLKHSDIFSAKLKKNTLVYTQATSGGALHGLTARIYPELHTRIPQICGQLKQIYIGAITLQCSIDDQGMLEPDELISFDPCEGWPPYSGKEYTPAELKDLVIQMSQDDS